MSMSEDEHNVEHVLFVTSPIALDAKHLADEALRTDANDEAVRQLTAAIDALAADATAFSAVRHAAAFLRHARACSALRLGRFGDARADALKCVELDVHGGAWHRVVRAAERRVPVEAVVAEEEAAITVAGDSVVGAQTWKVGGGTAPKYALAAVAAKAAGDSAVGGGDFSASAAAYAVALGAVRGVEPGAARARAVLRANRALCAACVGKPQIALEDARAATEACPSWGRGWARRIAAASSAGEWGEANACFAEAIVRGAKEFSCPSGACKALAVRRTWDVALPAAIALALRDAAGDTQCYQHLAHMAATGPARVRVIGCRNDCEELANYALLAHLARIAVPAWGAAKVSIILVRFEQEATWFVRAPPSLIGSKAGEEADARFVVYAQRPEPGGLDWSAGAPRVPSSMLWHDAFHTRGTWPHVTVFACQDLALTFEHWRPMVSALIALGTLLVVTGHTRVDTWSDEALDTQQVFELLGARVAVPRTRSHLGALRARWHDELPYCTQPSAIKGTERALVEDHGFYLVCQGIDLTCCPADGSLPMGSYELSLVKKHVAAHVCRRAAAVEIRPIVADELSRAAVCFEWRVEGHAADASFDLEGVLCTASLAYAEECVQHTCRAEDRRLDALQAERCDFQATRLAAKTACMQLRAREAAAEAAQDAMEAREMKAVSKMACRYNAVPPRLSASADMLDEFLKELTVSR